MTEDRDRTPLECTEFQDQLPDLFEAGADLSQHPHLQSCENCSSLVRDLEYIAAQAKLLLPIHDPSPEVWKNIHEALDREANHPSTASASATGEEVS